MNFHLNILKVFFKNEENVKKVSQLLFDNISSKGDRSLFWFDNIDLENYVIQGDFYYRRFSMIRQYDIETNSIKNIKTEIINFNQFAVDFNHNLLEFYGATSDFSRFNNSLFKSSSVIESIDVPTINLSKFYKNSLGRIDTIRLRKVIVPEFSWKNDLIGKYEARVLSGSNEIELIDFFNDRLSSISFEFLNDGQSIDVTVSKHARYRITCTEAYKPIAIDFLKSIQSKSYA